MYTFDPRDDGLLAVHEPSARPVAHVETRVVSETNRRAEVTLPVEKWRVHFTGYRFTPDQLETFLLELVAQEG